MYDYQKERPDLFTETGQVIFLEIRDRTKRLLKTSGACRAQEMMQGTVGSSWTHLACIDRMVELGELREVSTNKPAAQFRVFVANKEF